jgi:hypothetical protein
VWSVAADGSDARQLLGASDPDTGAPAVLESSPDGSNLLAWYPRAAGMMADREPIYAVVDLATGAATPVEAYDDREPSVAFVMLVGFSPDGSAILTLTRNTVPDNLVAARDVASGGETILTTDGLPSGGPIAYGLSAAWASDGTAFVPGAGDFSHGTLLTIDGAGGTPSGG